MRSSLINKIIKKISIALLMLMLFLAAPVYSDEPAKKGDELIAQIRHMEALLLRPCDKVEKLMNDLISHGRGYQLVEEERANIYSEWTKTYTKYISDFVVVEDEKGAAIQGKFIKRFMELKKLAEEGGILADGPMPNMDPIKLAHSKRANKYFYFAELGSLDAKIKINQRLRLEEEYEKLVSDWNKARDEFYKQFDDKGAMKNYAITLEEKTKQGREHQLKYLDLSSELTTLALSGNYEHCLGEMQAMNYSYSNPWGDNLFDPLYVQGEKKTPGSLPGMGFKFTSQKMYKPITKPNIGAFPLALHLKLNGTDYFKLEKDILEIKIKAAEEETRILGFGIGIMGEFAFKTAHKTLESLAAPVLIVTHACFHPINSIHESVNFIVGLSKAIKDMEPSGWIRKGADFFWDNTAKPFVAIGEIAKDVKDLFAEGRFDPKKGETLQQEIDRLKAKLDSTMKVKEGMEVASTITSIAVEALLDKGTTMGAGKLHEVRAAFKQQSKLQMLLSKVDNLEDAKKVVGKIDDVIPDNKKVMQDLLKEQSDNAKEFSKFLTGDRPLEQGVRLGDDVGKKISVVDAHGQPVQIRVGDQLGKPGGVNTALVDADNSNAVFRKTNKPMTKEELDKVDAHDRFGRDVIEKKVGGSSIRVAKIEGEFYEQTADGIVRYQKVERVEATALDQVAKQGGRMTKGQQLALEQAHRDLNNAGYVWMDNTPKNYSFEKLPGGEDRWRVVVIDPDGIYPIKGNNPVVAKALQEAVETTPKSLENTNPDNAFVKFLKLSNNYKDAAKKANLIDTNLNNAIDWDQLRKANPKMIASDDITNLHLDYYSKRLDVADDIKKLGDDKLAESFDNHRYSQLLNDPEYKKLVEKQKETNKKIDEMVEKMGPQIKQAEKAMEAGPKPPVASDKPSSIDKDLADILNFLSQQTASAISAENCALLRKRALAGSKEEWLKKALVDCVDRGF